LKELKVSIIHPEDGAVGSFEMMVNSYPSKQRHIQVIMAMKT
jgi:hypothetical protein